MELKRYVSVCKFFEFCACKSWYIVVECHKLKILNIILQYSGGFRWVSGVSTEATFKFNSVAI